MKHNLLADVLRPLEQSLLDRGKANNTVESYLIAARRYIEWFMGRYQRVPDKLYRENVADFMAFLEKEEVAPTTFNSYLHGLRAWNQQLVDAGVQSDSVIMDTDFKKVQKQYASPAIHTETEVEQFLQTVLETGSKRDYALVNLLAYTGLRVSEAIKTTLNDLHLDSQELLVRDSKGRKSRTVLLSDRVVRLLREYLRSERPKYRLSEISPYLFLSNRSRTLSRITVYKAFEKYSTQAGIEPAITPHHLRHFFCSYALENEFDVHEVAAMVGHSNIHTTLLYTNPSRKKMLDKLNQL